MKTFSSRAFIINLHFVEEHLYNELRWLLVSATLWQARKEIGEDKFPPNFGVITMDSAFLHARSLFESFTYTHPEQKRRKPDKKLIIWKNFGLLDRLQSPVYDKWIEPLHHHVMHLENRMVANNTDPTTGDHLRDQVLVFAHELIRLWKELTLKANPAYAKVLTDKLEEAIEKSRKIAEIYDSYGFKSPFKV